VSRTCHVIRIIYVSRHYVYLKHTQFMTPKNTHTHTIPLKSMTCVGEGGIIFGCGKRLEMKGNGMKWHWRNEWKM